MKDLVPNTNGRWANLFEIMKKAQEKPVLIAKQKYVSVG